MGRGGGSAGDVGVHDVDIVRLHEERLAARAAQREAAEAGDDGNAAVEAAPPSPVRVSVAEQLRRIFDEDGDA